MSRPRNTSGPAYVVIDSGPLGVVEVALRAFGGHMGDPIAAAIKVNRYTVVKVIAPAARRDWGTAREEQFHAAVIELAKSHDLMGNRGAVSVLFDPPDTDTDDGQGPVGEPVARPDD